MLTMDALETMAAQVCYLRMQDEASGADLAADVCKHNRLVDDARTQLQRARVAASGGMALAEGSEMELRFCIAFLSRQARHLLGRHGRALAEAELA